MKRELLDDDRYELQPPPSWACDLEGNPPPARWSDPQIYNLDGVPWHKAPVPRRWHQCWVQTQGWIGLNITDRCACGAIRPMWGRWMERNSRKRGR